MPKYPNITIQLSDKEDDQFAIIITCLRALKENNLGTELDNFVTDLVQAGSNGLICAINKWFKVE